MLTESDASLLLNFAYNGTLSDSPIAQMYRSRGSSQKQAAVSLEAMQLPDGRAGSNRAVWDLSQHTKLQPFVRHTFAASDRFKPLRLEINGRKGRRVVCVLAEDLRHYRIFDLDFAGGEAGEGMMQDASAEGLWS